MSDEVTPMYPTLFSQVQDYVVERLNSDYQLSAVGLEFIPEHIRDVEYLIKRNLGKQGMVGIVNTVKAQYGGHDGETQAWQMEVECDILENPPIRKAWMKKNDLSAGTVVDCCNFVNESLAGPYSPTYGQFCSKSVEVGEDSGIVVGKCLFDTYALGEISGAISGESHYVIKWATKDELSALSAETWTAIEELSAEISGGSWRDAIDQLSADVSSISRNVSNLTDQVDSVEQQIENLDDLAVKYTDDDKYLVVLNPRPNWTTSLRINDGSAIGNSQIQFGSGQGRYRNYITRNRMVLGLPEDNEAPEDVGDTQIQFGGVHNDADLILGAGIHIISSTEKGKSQILLDDQRLYVVTPAEVSAGQTLKAVQVYDDPTLNTMSFRGSANQAGMKSREEPKWHWEYHSANLPDKTSDLTNDSGYVTSSEVSAEISSISQDVSSISQDIQDLSSEVISAYEEIPSIWRVWEYDPGLPGLTFTAEEANSTVAMTAVGSAPSVSLEYSRDGSTWSDFIVGETTVTLPNVGDKMFLRAKTTNSGMATNSSNHNKFVMTGSIEADGSVMYLLDQSGSESATIGTCCFWSLFNNCTSLTHAPELPATTLGNQAYAHMFDGCTSLTTAPDLPATALARACYSNMFRGCTSLTTPPSLPATTLVQECYNYMFFGCRSLNQIKIAYTGNFSGTGVPTKSFYRWVYNVPSTGTFYYNGSDTTRGQDAIPTNWTIQTF